MNEKNKNSGNNLSASMQARMAAYQEALKAKREMHRNNLQKQAEASPGVDRLKESLRNELAASPTRRSKAVGKLDPMSPSMSPLQHLTQEEREERIERRARANLNRMLQVVEGNRNLSQKQKDDFASNRGRYITAVEKMAPEPLPPPPPPSPVPSTDSKSSYSENKKRSIEKEAVKKEAYGSLKNAWDGYEESARDRPAEPTEEEMRIQKQLASVEDRIDVAWVRYAEEVVKRAVRDNDTPPQEVEAWRRESVRLAAESRERRALKSKQERRRATVYWKGEVMRLKAERQRQDDELGSDEEWVTASDGVVSDISDDDDDDDVDDDDDYNK